MRKSFKCLALVASLAFAGLLSLTSLLFNSVLPDQITEVKASEVYDGDTRDNTVASGISRVVGGKKYQVVWFFIEGYWWVNDQEFTSYYYSTDNWSTEYSIGSGTPGTSDYYSEIRGGYFAKIFIPTGETKITFARKSKSQSRWKQDMTDVDKSTINNEVFVEISLNYNRYSDAGYQNGAWMSFESFQNTYAMPFYFAVVNNWINTYSDLSKYTIWETDKFNESGSISSTTNSRIYSIPETAVKTINGKDYIQWYIGNSSLRQLYEIVLRNPNYSSDNNDKTPNLRYDGTGSYPMTLFENVTYYVYTNNSGGAWHDYQYGYWGYVGESSNYYLIGNGSFCKKDNPWGMDAAVNMDAATGDNTAVLLNQYFEAGDTFQITNPKDGTWKSWNQFNSGDKNNHFKEAVYNLLKVSGTTSWQNNPTISYKNYNSINGGSGDIRTDGNHDMYIQAPSWWYTNSFSYGGVNYYKTGEADGWLAATYIEDYVENSHTYKIYRVNDVVPEGKDGYQVYRNNGSKNDSFASFSLTGNGNIVVKDTGYYNIYISSSDSNLYITPVTHDFSAGESIYLDLNGQWSGQTPKIHYWNGSGSADATMTEVHSHGGSNKLYEWNIEQISSADPTYVKFYYGNWTGQIDSDLLLSGSIGCNTFQLTTATHGIWLKDITKEERAVYFGDYFNSLTDGSSGGICSGKGDTNLTELKSRWALLNTEYGNMCSNAQTVVQNTTGKDEFDEGTDLEKAMGRYDYIVFHKQYILIGTTLDETDFIDRDGKSWRLYSTSNFALFDYLTNGDEKTSIVVIVIASSLSLVSITFLSILLIKKRKEYNS